MSDQNMDQSAEATGANGSTDVTTAKTFSQEEVNRIIAARLAQAEKKFADVDVNEYRSLKQQQTAAQEAEAIKRQEFEKVLKAQKEAADNEIRKLRGDLESVKIDGAFINAASKHKAVNPDHVTKLLKSKTRLNSEGAVEVLDDQGAVRYNPNTAEPATVEDLVQEFLTNNPYFRSAGPAGAGSKSNLGSESTKQTVDITKLNMADPKDRAKYKEFRKANGIR